MGKKVNNGGQNSKPTPIPNKEIIQRMNFLHQAAVLVSGALCMPTASTSSTARKGAQTAQEREKQANTAHKVQAMSNIGALIGTQPAQPARPASSAHTIPIPPNMRASNQAFIARANTQREKELERVFRRYWKHQGLTEAELEVKLNKRRRSFARKQAKAKIASLEIGSASYIVASPSRRTDIINKRKNLPMHPSQVEHRNLACHYVNDIRTMARKNVLRMDPVIKRTMCRNCNALLIPGVTSRVKILPSATHVHIMRTQCLACNVARSIPCPPIRPAVEPLKSTGLEASEKITMQEDTAPSSAATSTTPTLSEGSATIQDDAGTPVEAGSNLQDSARSEVGMDSANIPPEQGKASGKSNRKAAMRKEKRQRKKQAADPIVPGRKGQYANLRFHERPEHLIVQVNKPAINA